MSRGNKLKRLLASSARNASEKNLSSLFVSAVRENDSSNKPKSKLVTTKKPVFPAQTRSPALKSSTSGKAAGKPQKHPIRVSSEVLDRLRKATGRNGEASAVNDEDSARNVTSEISTILSGSNDSPSLPSSVNAFDIPWFSDVPLSHACTSQRWKELSRERKQKWIFKSSQTRRFERLVKMCAQKLGNESTLEVFGKLGRETGVKEYNALIGLCISRARQSNDEEDTLIEIHKAFQLIRSMREKGFQIEEESYRPLLMYLIELGMTQEFYLFSGLIKDENPKSYSRIGYYEMLLWIKVGDEDKILELCNSVGVNSSDDNYLLAESYLLAFCENDRKKELLQLLEVLDIKGISSLEYVTRIFKSLGRLSLENFAVKFLLSLKTTEVGVENISSFIYDYAISMPNIVVKEVVSKCDHLHEKVEVEPCSASYEKLISFCCNSSEVHAALDIVDQMCRSGLVPSVGTFNPILHAIEQHCELHLVHPIYSVMRRHNLKLKGKTFESLISLFVKMKDFEGAYNLLTDLEEMNLIPTTSMYNAILVGYFREKNVHGALMVLKQMEDAGVKPDSETFSYLLLNCECEEDILKYRDKMQCSGVQDTKHVYMALINAYVNCGKLDQAKQVILDPGLPVKYMNEIKSVLVSALSANGQISDALEVYDSMKQAGHSLEPKAVVALIEHLRSEGELDRLLQLLGELNDSNFWFDACSRVVLYCVRSNLSNSAVDLLKQLKEKDELGTYIVIDQVFSQICEAEPTNLEIGLELLEAVKVDLGLHPSRTSLDFLLSTCGRAKDPSSAQFIWSDYIKAGLPFNALTYLRMYQVLLACGEFKSAEKMLRKIPKDDPHVCRIIIECEKLHSPPK